MEQNINPGLAVIGLSGTRPWTLIRGNVVSELLCEKGKTACLVFNITIPTGPFLTSLYFPSISRIFQMNVGNCKDSQQRGGKFNHNNRTYSVQLLLSDTQVHSLEQTTLSLDLRSCSITLTISIAYLLHYVLLRTVIS